MKKALLTILVPALICITSCKKNSTNGSGTWTFETATSTATSAIVSNGSFLNFSTLNSSDSATYSTLQFEFDGNSLPTSSGTYTVVSPYPKAANQVAIYLTTNGVAPNTKTYQSTGASGTLTLNVSVSGGKISVSGSGIEMDNANKAADSSAITFNVTH